MNPILVTPQCPIKYNGSSTFPILIKRNFQPVVKDGMLYISQQTQERKISIFNQFPSVYIFSTLLNKEYEQIQNFYPLFNAMLKRSEYINSSSFAIQLQSLKLKVSLNNDKIIKFIEKEAVENDRNVAIKILKQLDPIILKYITKSTLSYEQGNFSQLIKNLENEKLLSNYKIFKLSTFSLIALDAADKISQMIDGIQVLLNYSTSDLLKEVGFISAPISQQFIIERNKDMQNIMEFPCIADQINKKAKYKLIEKQQFSQIFQLSEIQQILTKICYKTNFLSIKNDIIRQNTVLKSFSTQEYESEEQYLKIIFSQVGLILNKTNILYQLQDGLFYPLIIKLLFHQNNCISMTALNIPFQEIIDIYSEISINYESNLQNCDFFKDRFSKIMTKTRHTNIALGQAVLKSLTKDLSKIFKDFNIDPQSPLFFPEGNLERIRVIKEQVFQINSN